ncbi:MAG: alkaline shock response membrane anchor protein AmaP [Kiritimatiellae bacterium]|nr:alkaline shock response membrane anchor protein AmaP [Verrucomicrobiota bacterium]MCG2658732.1 alkaline shock response membrane anchor protein AmaP [Kiritimatiellia bacterium]
MNILHGLIKCVLSVGLMIFGILLLADVVAVHTPVGDFLINDKLGRLLTGISAIFLVLLYWLTAIPVKEERFLTFENEGGTISISVKAINDFLAKLADEFAGIIQLRADVAALRDGHIEVRLDVTVKAGTKVQQLSQVLQQRVRESMRENLGIAEIHAVKVNVSSIVAADEPASGRPAERADWQDASV